MRIIRDPETVYNCYIQEHVTDFCSQPPSAFHLRFYEEGEFLCSPMQPADCLLLLLDGTIYLYGLNQSGRYLPISARSDVMLLGDFEYATGTETQFYAEARSRIRCLALPIEPNRASLDKDIIFLHSLIRSLTDKFSFQSEIEIPSSTIEERLMRYMQISGNHRIEGIEATALVLRCSKRQLLRALKKQCEAGKIERIGHGVYGLIHS